MPDLTTHGADLRAIADTYRDRRDAGSLDHTAFVAAIIYLVAGLFTRRSTGETAASPLVNR